MDGAEQRRLLRLTLLVTACSSGLTLLTTRGDWQSTLLLMPFAAIIAYWSLRLARSMAARATRRAPADATRAVEATAPSSLRPEHAQRRRQRRRERGRRA